MTKIKFILRITSICLLYMPFGMLLAGIPPVCQIQGGTVYNPSNPNGTPFYAENKCTLAVYSLAKRNFYGNSYYLRNLCVILKPSGEIATYLNPLGDPNSTGSIDKISYSSLCFGNINNDWAGHWVSNQIDWSTLTPGHVLTFEQYGESSNALAKQLHTYWHDTDFDNNYDVPCYWGFWYVDFSPNRNPTAATAKEEAIARSQCAPQ